MNADAYSIRGIARPAPDPVANPLSTPRPTEAAPARTPNEASLTVRPRKPGSEGLSDEQVRTLAEALGETLSTLNKGIHYEIDESTDRIITTIIDKETQQVVRQIPPEEVVEVARRLRALIGVLLDIEV